MDALQKSVTLLLNGREELSAHSKRVSELASHFGISLRMGYRDLNNLKIGALLHDIGKIEIPEDVLFKEGKLTDDEFSLIKEHPFRGYKLLTASARPFSKDILDIVLEHHERLDAKGYPFKREGQQINPLAKITSLCDVFDAITHARCYKDAYQVDFALQQIESGLDRQFDRDLGKKFIAFINEKWTVSLKSDIDAI
ncbi:HD domain-containing protein (plasmid) [Aneurinibacillus sp. Ricciae_BoGa-3]|uniref:HD-GYP domain-containing protein n=1 Tax=Aneurinibacillus sp. Ricciae_BoGa-3 TaxID=3022697 RepID=UPI0023416CE1|nr:HD domain-containing phosphohydrolase [Aneurinibacillus sp. Ricciae_BoGa-3]WCK56980.1 HD domain-containing protein [Aneurinibacillus sp. Ricciae_BoGa-3]